MKISKIKPGLISLAYRKIKNQKIDGEKF